MRTEKEGKKQKYKMSKSALTAAVLQLQQIHMQLTDGE